MRLLLPFTHRTPRLSGEPTEKTLSSVMQDWRPQGLRSCFHSRHDTSYAFGTKQIVNTLDNWMVLLSLSRSTPSSIAIIYKCFRAIVKYTAQSMIFVSLSRYVLNIRKCVLLIE